MQTSIQQVNPAEYELEIKATADDLAPELEKALRAQRTQTTLKGFRPGKVPISLVKRLFGKAIALDLAEKSIQETYENTVLKSNEYKVLGHPTISKIDYELDGDLHAVVRFGVQPDFELKDLSSETIQSIVHEITDEDVEKEIQQILEQQAELIPVEGSAEEDHYVVVDIQRLDDASGTPIIGDKDENVALFLNDKNLPDAIRDALIGKSAGDTVRVEIPHEHGHEHDEELHSELLELPTPRSEHHTEPHTHAYQVTVKEVKRRELPEFDAELIKEISGGQFEDVDAFRQNVRQMLESTWEKGTRDLLREGITDKMVKLHPIPVPESVINSFLDSYVEDVKRRNNGRLPENFDEAAFRKNNRDLAEKQSRWMLIRNKVIETENIEVTDEDRQKYFQESASANVSADDLSQFYKSVPSLMEQVDETILTNKVFDLLSERFIVEEKTFEEASRELKKAREEEAAEETAPANEDSEQAPAGEAAADAESDTGETEDLPEKEQE